MFERNLSIAQTIVTKNGRFGNTDRTFRVFHRTWRYVAAYRGVFELKTQLKFSSDAGKGKIIFRLKTFSSAERLSIPPYFSAMVFTLFMPKPW